MAIRVGMSVAEAIMQLTKGFKKMMGRDPSGLEKIKIQQEAVQRVEDLNKVVDMEGKVIDTSKGIMGGKQIQDSPEFGARIKETYDAAKGPGKGQEMVDALKSPGAQRTKSMMEDQLGMKLYGDETFEEILEIQRTGKHPRGEPSAKRLKEELMKTDNPFSDLVKTTEKGPKSVQQRRKEAEEALKNKNVVPFKDPEGKADGGRIGLKAGMTRRAFMKLMGAAGAGIGAAKTGLMTLGKNIEPVTETVKETVTKAPEYFFALMDKIRKFGKSVDDVTADPRVERTYVYKDYELKENAFGEPGEMIITKKTDQGPFGYKEESMRYKKGGSTEDGMIADEYEELTIRPDQEGKLKDVEEGIDDASEIIKEATGDAPPIKKAAGGLAYMLGE